MGIISLKIVHRPGRENAGADALSCNPLMDNQEATELDASMLQVTSQAYYPTSSSNFRQFYTRTKEKPSIKTAD